jgi:hypothetical protein
MNKVFVSWQESETRIWYPIGCLEFDCLQYKYYYINAVEEAIARGFDRIFPFPELDKTYQSVYLFPFFSNRLMSRSRPDYQRYINALNIAPDRDLPMAVLSRSGGWKETDNYEIFPSSTVENDLYQTHFFLRGLRYQPETQTSLASLRVGDNLLVTPEPDNKLDRQALKLIAADRLPLGYFPRYLAADIYPLFQQNPELVKVTIDRINQPPTPVQYRLLCHLHIKCDPNFQPFGGKDYQKLDRAIVDRLVPQSL